MSIRRRAAIESVVAALLLIAVVVPLSAGAAFGSVRGDLATPQRRVVAVHKCAIRLWKGVPAAKVPGTYTLPAGLHLPLGAAVYAYPTQGTWQAPLLYVAGPSGSSCIAGVGADSALWAALTPPGQDQPTLNFVWRAGGTCMDAGTDGAFFGYDACRAVYSGPRLPSPVVRIPTHNHSYVAGFTTTPVGYGDLWLGSGERVFYTTDVVAIGTIDGTTAEAASCALPIEEQGICDEALGLFVDQSYAAMAKPPFSAPLIAAVWRLVAAAHRQRRKHAQPAPLGLVAALRSRAGQAQMDVYVYYNTFSRAWVEFVAVLPSGDTGEGIAHYVNGTWVVVSGPGGGGLLCGAAPGAVPPKVLSGFAFVHSLQCKGDG